MAEAPLYDIGDVVYLRESAAMGFLETMKIESIHYFPCQPISYTMCQSFVGPNINTTFGERITHRYLNQLSLHETALITKDEAVCLVRMSLNAQLNQIESLIPDEGTCDG